jgi:hypothetical protein
MLEGARVTALKHGLRCLGDMDQAARLDPTFLDPQLPMALHDYWKSRKLALLFGGRRAGAIARMERVWREGRYLTVEAAYSLSAVLQSEGELERALAVNLLGPFRLTKAVLPIMRRQRAGRSLR